MITPGKKPAKPTSKTQPLIALGTVNPKPQAVTTRSTESDDLLLVCVQCPFEAVGVSSLIVDSTVPASGGSSQYLWRLEAVMEMNPPRFFAGWATRSLFVLDLKVEASVAATSGGWGGQQATATASGTCRVMVMRDGNKVRFSLESAAAGAPEKPLPSPDARRFLNADIAFLTNGATGITAAATAVISAKPRAKLIAGSNVQTKGFAFDPKWRTSLETGDGDTTAQGSWAFAIMTRADYSVFCAKLGLAEHVE